mmetsp:Transcript_9141/g.26254  ORF Transcript_9141/g.26254 Transcript_9141/m.26254 type:complete len:216 (-) Transcript_9141:288-935(-)
MTSQSSAPVKTRNSKLSCKSLSLMFKMWRHIDWNHSLRNWPVPKSNLSRKVCQSSSPAACSIADRKRCCTLSMGSAMNSTMSSTSASPSTPCKLLKATRSKRPSSVIFNVALHNEEKSSHSKCSGWVRQRPAAAARNNSGQAAPPHSTTASWSCRCAFSSSARALAAPLAVVASGVPAWAGGGTAGGTVCVSATAAPCRSRRKPPPTGRRDFGGG